ncbi:MAG: ribosome maturation factor RimM [Candidatus Hydrogenedentes bacterium]|nr:ribosome maturation factor RimM [Candidatus Hydrogenedentota bacterium]
MTGSWVEIGVVRSVNPARRELRVQPRRSGRSRIEGADWVYVGRSANTPVRCKVANVTAGNEWIVIALAAGVPRDAVAGMRNAVVYVEPETSSARQAGEYEVSELIGLEVVSNRGERIGTIRDAMETGANDVIEIETATGKRFLLPVIESIVESIHWNEGQVVVGEYGPYAVDDED